ncbi:tetratricopeptide repeat protein, partial [bacterium]
MRVLALLFLSASPALALTDAQLAAKVRAERRQYDNSVNALENRQDKLDKANQKLNDLREAKDEGAAKGKVGGQPCKIDSCIGKQQKAVQKQEALAAKALAAAKKQAEEYVAQEQAYANQTGHYLDPTTMDGAKTFLSGPAGPTPTTDPGLETPTTTGKGCVDSRGIPCIGDGTTDFESPTGTVDPAAPVVDQGYESGVPPGGAPGTKVGDIATGHEGEDLSKFAAAGAQSYGHGGGGGGFTGAERVALGGSASADLAALRADIARGASKEAQDAISAMLKKNPRSFQAHLLDAEAKNSAGDWQGAEFAAREAIALNPTDPRGYKELAVSLLHQGKDAEALEAAQRAAQLDPDDADAQMLMAFAFEGMGRKDEMMRAVERAAELDPGRFSSYLDLARKGKRLFDRRRTMKGWHGIPVPAPG